MTSHGPILLRDIVDNARDSEKVVSNLKISTTPVDVLAPLDTEFRPGDMNVEIMVFF